MLPFLIILLATQALAGNLCYFPGGVQSQDVPCDPNAEVSMCCGSVAACLSNGLCKDESTTNSTGVSFARGTCTDPQWASPICPQQCQLNQDTPKNNSAYDFRLNGVQVWECNAQGFGSPANYCCESAAEKTRCCATATALFSLLAASQGNALAVQTAVPATTTKATSKAPATTSPATSAGTTTAPASSTKSGGAGGATVKDTQPSITTAPSAPVSSDAAKGTSAKGAQSVSAVPETNLPKESSTPSNDDGNDKGSSGYSTATVVGIGVGASVASAVVVIVFVVFLLRRKQRKQTEIDGLSYYGRPPSSTSQYRYGPDRDVWYDGRRALPAGALPRLDMAEVDSIRHSPVDRYASPAISELEPAKLSPILGKSPRQKSRVFEMP